MEALFETNFQLNNLQKFYRGKVRDVFYFKDKIALLASDRISAFDVVLPKAIPYKGQVLSKIAAYYLEATKEIVPNFLEAFPHPNLSIGKYCDAIPLEMVVRGYLAGHSWREYASGKRVICGETMPDGMKESQAFPTPIITPATKAEEGHDEDISAIDAVKKGIVTQEEYDTMREYSLRLYAYGQKMANERGLILVDTKYEFGRYQGQIFLMDEVHTPDSSRYYYADGYADRLAKGEKQKQLSKEFVREWLMDNGFQGKEGQKIPEMTPKVVEDISLRYIELYEVLTGEKFTPTHYKENASDLQSILQSYIDRV